MIRLLVDQNFNGHILDGLTRHDPGLNFLHVRNVGLAAAPDPVLLEWAATQDRVLLTHDRRTIPAFAYSRVATSQRMPGVFLVGGQGARSGAAAYVAGVDATARGSGLNSGLGRDGERRLRSPRQQEGAGLAAQEEGEATRRAENPAWIKNRKHEATGGIRCIHHATHPSERIPKSGTYGRAKT